MVTREKERQTDKSKFDFNIANTFKPYRATVLSSVDSFAKILIDRKSGEISLLRYLC